MGNCFSKLNLCCLENSKIKPILELECPKIYKKEDYQTLKKFPLKVLLELKNNLKKRACFYSFLKMHKWQSKSL